MPSAKARPKRTRRFLIGRCSQFGRIDPQMTQMLADETRNLDL
jgi:hypothetical protein